MFNEHTVHSFTGRERTEEGRELGSIRLAEEIKRNEREGINDGREGESKKEKGSKRRWEENKRHWGLQ